MSAARGHQVSPAQRRRARELLLLMAPWEEFARSTPPNSDVSKLVRQWRTKLELIAEGRWFTAYTALHINNYTEH